MKPYVICHMMCSVDGRILSRNWGKMKSTEVYEQINSQLGGDGWMCGRVTMEKDFTDDIPLTLAPAPHAIARKDWVADHDATSFAVAIDKNGKLNWSAAEIAGDHIIEVLGEQVSDDYLAFLQYLGISYLFAGKKEIDFELVLTKLHQLFHIDKLILSGGGHINGALLEKGLIDELSLLYLPVADGTPGTPTIFEKTDCNSEASHLQLLDVQRLEDDVLWMRYKLK